MSALLDEVTPTLPAGWYWTTMGEIAEVIGGGTPRTNDPTNFDGGDVPWITPADLSGYTEKYISHGARFITRRGLEASSARLLSAGTVLFTSRAPIGYVAIARNPVATNQGFKSFTLKDGVLPEYVYWWLKGSKQRAEALASGTTFLELSGTNAKKLPIPIAPIDEQRRVVAELEMQFSRLDEAVDNLKRVKANLKRYKASVLDAAVKGRIGAKSAASDAELPTGWQLSSIGELATVGTGATPARSNEAFYGGGEIPWITSSAVNEPFVDAADKFVTDEALRQTNLTLYPPGTLLVAMYGEGRTRGKCSELRIAATTNQALAALQVEPTVRPWLKLFLEHNYDNTRRIASGGVQPNLNLGLIRAIKLPLPPAEEQVLIVAEIDRRLSVVREVEAEVDANLKRAHGLRQSTLGKAFSKARSNDPSS